SLDSGLKVLAPVRDLQWTRDEETAFAAENGIPIPKQSTYSVDANLFGRSIECGPLENPQTVPPWDAFEWVAAPEHAPENAETVKIHFQNGVPIALETAHDNIHGTLSVIQALNALAGKHGIGVFDHVEDRLVGFKSREVYECPAAAVLLAAHADLEKLVLAKDELDFKHHADRTFAEATFQGKWFSPLMDSLRAFLVENQQAVTGWVSVKLYKGACHVNARFSPHSLHSHAMATYGANSTFEQGHGAGFCALYSLSTVTANQVKKCWTTPDSKPLMPC
ncbi:MAG: argininosuccinate synthase, partial [Candidatus Micrarchaeota archaeon]|nr:argininosuccinate synthase [Candidatus Micrarchaeota archaeon]